MAKTNKNARPQARLPKGLRDIESAELRALNDMLEKTRGVYERYGFEPLETPAFEYTDALGKFLPDQDRPNEGVFSFQDAGPEAREQGDSGQWLSLRYDLTAPLARYVAQNYQTLPKPFRRYAVGRVWRNEKPGPGRYREFMQFDADTVGAESVVADAEMCMLAADTMEALGFERGKYVIKVNNRKVVDGVLEVIGLGGESNAAKRLTVLRAIDKLDRLKFEGVEQLLGEGRKDESGDFTAGAGLSEEQISRVISYLSTRYFDDGLDVLKAAERRGERAPVRYQSGEESFPSNEMAFNAWERAVGNSEIGKQGVAELREIGSLVEAAGYGPGRIYFDSSVVRGLDYYTSLVFEADLTFEVKDDKGRPVRFGSVGGGGRYDDLVARFTGQKVPATGFSIGVSRLQAALAVLERTDAAAAGPVVVLVMDRDRIADYQRMANELRAAGIRAEMYLGAAGMKAQMKYADKRGAPCVVIQGSHERDAGQVQIKDLIEGAKLAEKITDQKEWREGRPAQVSVKEADLVAEVGKILARHGLMQTD